MLLISFQTIFHLLLFPNGFLFFILELLILYSIFVILPFRASIEFLEILSTMFFIYLSFLIVVVILLFQLKLSCALLTGYAIIYLSSLSELIMMTTKDII